MLYLSQTIESLKQEVGKMKKRNQEIEIEKETYIYQLGEVQKRNKEYVEQLEKSLTESKSKFKEVEEKLSRVELIEDSIIKLFEVLIFRLVVYLILLDILK